MTILLTLILIILLLDFYLKYNKLIKKMFNKTKDKVVKKPDLFRINKTGYGEKIIDDLEKEL